MKAPPRRAALPARCLAVLGLLASALARAQNAPAAAAPAAAPAPYLDRYIAGGTLAPDISTGDLVTSDTSGLARSLRVDGVVSSLSQQGAGAPPAENENGVIVDAQWDSASYGAWSADLGARTGGSQRSAAGNGYGDASFALH